MNRVIIGCILILVCISAVSADSQPTITGQVKDSEGAVIAKARVLIHWDPSSGRSSGVTKGSTQDVSVLTDDSGVYSAPVPTGFYDVFVSFPAFTPVAAKVIVKEGRRVVLNVKLYLDPLVSKEIGGMEVEGVSAVTDEALPQLEPRFKSLYAKTGRPSIAPEKLLRALLLQALYSARSERLLMGQLDCKRQRKYTIDELTNDPDCLRKGRI